jgi:hypothetical protein
MSSLLLWCLLTACTESNKQSVPPPASAPVKEFTYKEISITKYQFEGRTWVYGYCIEGKTFVAYGQGGLIQVMGTNGRPETC